MLIELKSKDRAYSLTELGRLANAQVDFKIPIRIYFKSLRNLYDNANLSYRAKSYQEAYLYYLRFSSLILEELPKHPEYFEKKNEVQRKDLNQKCNTALTRLESLQPILQEQYKEYLEYIKSIPKPSVAISHYKVGDKGRNQVKRKDTNHDYSNADLASKVGSKKDSVSNMLQKEEIQDSTISDSKAWSLQKEASSVNKFFSDYSRQELTLKMPAAHKKGSEYSDDDYRIKSDRLESVGVAEELKPKDDNSTSTIKRGFAGNEVEKSNFAGTHHLENLQQNKCIDILEKYRYELENTPVLPPKPKEYINISTDENQSVQLEVEDKLEQDIDISTGTIYMTKEGVALRRFELPHYLSIEFLKIAEKNTIDGIETCGILCGKIGDGVLRVIALLIPKQQATSNTCTTTNEEEVAFILSDNDWVALGWIHTHPTQSCFMSSLDLHTHCSYQLMLPEAIAIVCSPTHEPSMGIFRLTDPPGLRIIKECPITTNFHPHEEDSIYSDALDDGYVKIVNSDFTIVDLR